MPIVTMHHYASGHLMQVGRSAPATRMFLFFCVAAVAARKAQLSARGITLQPHMGTAATAKRHEYRQPAWLSCCRCITRADVSATALFCKTTRAGCMHPRSLHGPLRIQPIFLSASPAQQDNYNISRAKDLTGASAPCAHLACCCTCWRHAAATQLQPCCRPGHKRAKANNRACSSATACYGQSHRACSRATACYAVHSRWHKLPGPWPGRAAARPAAAAIIKRRIQASSTFKAEANIAAGTSQHPTDSCALCGELLHGVPAAAATRKSG